MTPKEGEERQLSEQTYSLTYLFCECERSGTTATPSFTRTAHHQAPQPVTASISRAASHVGCHTPTRHTLPYKSWEHGCAHLHNAPPQFYTMHHLQAVQAPWRACLPAGHEPGGTMLPLVTVGEAACIRMHPAAAACPFCTAALRAERGQHGRTDDGGACPLVLPGGPPLTQRPDVLCMPPCHHSTMPPCCLPGLFCILQPTNKPAMALSLIYLHLGMWIDALNQS